MTSAQTGNSSLQLLEGEAAEVCVLLLEPEEFQTDVLMTVGLSSGELKCRDLLRGWGAKGFPTPEAVEQLAHKHQLVWLKCSLSWGKINIWQPRTIHK